MPVSSTLPQPLIVSILSERRAFQPFGLCGGGPGARGQNLLTLAGGAGAEARTISLGGKNTVHVARGDRLSILTPGGGGWGAPGGPGSRGGDGGADGGTGAVPVRTSGSLHQYAMTQESA
jgi:hypothetical protein